MKEALAHTRAVLVPIGCVEQHGYHLPLATDELTATATLGTVTVTVTTTATATATTTTATATTSATAGARAGRVPGGATTIHSPRCRPFRPAFPHQPASIGSVDPGAPFGLTGRIIHAVLN